MSKTLAEILGEQSHGGHAPGVSAASLRGALRGETLPITVTTTSKRFLVPTTWKNRHVRIQADGGDVYYQISLGADALADPAARATETALLADRPRMPRPERRLLRVDACKIVP